MIATFKMLGLETATYLQNAPITPDTSARRDQRNLPNVSLLPAEQGDVATGLCKPARSITFQLAEVAVPRQLFQLILAAIHGLRPLEAPT